MRIGAYIVFASICVMLVMPVWAQEQSGQVGETQSTQKQGQSGNRSLPQTTGADQERFEGTVVQLSPLQVRSLDGEVRGFVTADQQRLAVRTKQGDLVRVIYEVGPEVNTLRTIELLGTTLTGTIKEIAADKLWLVVRTQEPNNPKNEVNVPFQTTNQFQPLVTAMRPGDGIRATYIRDKGINTIRSLEWQSKSVDRPARWISLIVTAVALCGVAAVFTKGHPTSLYLGVDNRYSSSKFQTVLWFWIVISTYCAIVFHRIAAAGWSYVGGVDIPINLLILSGISVLTFATAKALTVGKVEQAVAKGEDTKPTAAAPKAGDLIQDDHNRTDLGDFQMVVITILAVIIYAITTVEFMQHIEFRRVVTMPDIDATLLAIFGLGQAAYLGKKATGDAGAGMTSEQAVKAATNAAAVTKEEATKAETAEQTAISKEKETQNAVVAVGRAATEVEAQPEVEKAENAAKAARDAANLAAAAAKAAAARADDARKLAATWAKELNAAASTRSLADLAQADATKAKAAANSADAAARNAETQAEAVKIQAS